MSTASFSLIRTNPLLTSNIKLVVTESDKLYFESFSANQELAKARYKKYPISLNHSYPANIKSFYANTTREIMFDVKKDVDDTKTTNDFSQQYEWSDYFAGVKYLNSTQYDEHFSYLSPLYIKDKEIPDYFIILKVSDPVNKPLDEQTEQTQHQYFCDLLSKSTIIKTISLQAGTNIGNLLRGAINDDQFPESPLTISYTANSLYSGISVSNGVYIDSPENLVSFFKSANPIKYADKFITEGYKRNGVIFPNIFNIEFLFNDDTTNDYEHNRYMGFYVSSSMLGKFKIDTNTLFNKQILLNPDTKIYNAIDPNYTRNLFISNVNGVELPLYNLDPSNSLLSSTENNLILPYIKDKNNNFHYPKFNYTQTQDSIKLSDKKINLKDFIGTNNQLALSDKGALVKDYNRSIATLEIKDDINNGDELIIYHPCGSNTQYETVVVPNGSISIAFNVNLGNSRGDKNHYICVTSVFNRKSGGTIAQIQRDEKACFIELMDKIQDQFTSLNNIHYGGSNILTLDYSMDINSPTYNPSEFSFSIPVPTSYSLTTSLISSERWTLIGASKITAKFQFLTIQDEQSKQYVAIDQDEADALYQGIISQYPDDFYIVGNSLIQKNLSVQLDSVTQSQLSYVGNNTQYVTKTFIERDVLYSKLIAQYPNDFYANGEYLVQKNSLIRPNDNTQITLLYTNSSSYGVWAMNYVQMYSISVNGNYVTAPTLNGISQQLNCLSEIYCSLRDGKLYISCLNNSIEISALDHLDNYASDYDNMKCSVIRFSDSPNLVEGQVKSYVNNLNYRCKYTVSSKRTNGFSLITEGLKDAINEIVLREFTAYRYENTIYVVSDSPKNVDKVIGIEWYSQSMNNFTINDISDLSQNIIDLRYGISTENLLEISANHLPFILSNKDRLLVKTKDGFSKIDSVVRSTTYFDSSDIQDAVEKYNTTIAISLIEDNNTFALSGGLFSVYYENEVEHGQFKIFDIKDLDFDFYSDKYSKVPYYENYKIYSNPANTKCLIKDSYYKVCGQGVVLYNGNLYSESQIFKVVDGVYEYSVINGTCTVIPSCFKDTVGQVIPFSPYLNQVSAGVTYNVISFPKGSYEYSLCIWYNGSNKDVSRLANPQSDFANFILNGVAGVDAYYFGIADGSGVDGVGYIIDKSGNKVYPYKPQSGTFYLRGNGSVLINGTEYKASNSSDFVISDIVIKSFSVKYGDVYLLTEADASAHFIGTPLADTDGEALNFAGLRTIQTGSDQSVSDNFITDISSRLYANRLNSEYDVNKENYVPSLNNLSKIVPTVCKWGYLDGKDVRENNYRLNNSLSMGFCNFAPSPIDFKRNKEAFTNEWYYVVGDVFADDKLKYDNYNTISHFDESDIKGSLNQDDKKFYSKIKYNKYSGYCETFFRGARVQFKEFDKATIVDTKNRPIPNPAYKNFDGYGFSVVLKAIEISVGEVPVKFKFITDDVNKYVVLLVTVAIGKGLGVGVIDEIKKINDYKFKYSNGVSPISHTLLYAFNNKKFDIKTESISSNLIPYTLSFSDTTNICGLSGNKDIDSKYFCPVYPFNSTFIIYDKAMSRNNGYCFVKAGSGADKVAAYQGRNTTSLILTNKDVFAIPVDSSSDSRPISGYSFTGENYITNAGLGFYDNLFSYITFANICDLINSYSTHIDYNGKKFYCEILRDYELKMSEGMGYEPIANTIGKLRPVKVIGYDLNVESFDSPYSLRRYEGWYEPIATDIFKFDSDNKTFRTKFDFGVIKNFNHIKCSNAPILSLENSAEYSSVYELVDETPIGHADISVLSSSWDFNFYNKYLTKSTFQKVAGTLSVMEDNTLINNVMKVPDNVEVFDFGTVSYSIDNGLVSATIDTRDAIVNKIISDGNLVNRFKQYIPDNDDFIGELEYDDYVKAYVKKNLLTLFNINQIKVFEKKIYGDVKFNIASYSEEVLVAKKYAQIRDIGVNKLDDYTFSFQYRLKANYGSELAFITTNKRK